MSKTKIINIQETAIKKFFNNNILNFREFPDDEIKEYFMPAQKKNYEMNLEIIESETIYVVARWCETNRIDIITLRPDEGTIQEALSDLSSYYMEQFKEVCICNTKDELRKKGYRLENY